MKWVIFLLTLMSLTAQIKTELQRAWQLKSENKNKESLEIYLSILKIDSMQIDAILFASELNAVLGFSESSSERKMDYFQTAINLAEKSVLIKPDSDAVYVALSRAYGRMAQILSIKEQLNMSKKVKASAEKAVQLNPKNDIAWHIIGKWNFRIAELSWFEKTIANVIFGGIPKDASFESAKNAFEKAVAIKPNGIAHLVELAKTLMELDQNSQAKTILQKAVAIKATESNDNEYLVEANKLLSNLN